MTLRCARCRKEGRWCRCDLEAAEVARVEARQRAAGAQVEPVVLEPPSLQPLTVSEAKRIGEPYVPVPVPVLFAAPKPVKVHRPPRQRNRAPQGEFPVGPTPPPPPPRALGPLVPPPIGSEWLLDDVNHIVRVIVTDIDTSQSDARVCAATSTGRDRRFHLEYFTKWARPVPR